MNTLIAFLMFGLSLLMVFYETFRIGRDIPRNIWFVILYYGWLGYSVCLISDPFKWVPVILYVLLSGSVMIWICGKDTISKTLSYLRFGVVCANTALLLYRIFPTV